MQYLKIVNNGEVEKEALTLLGASSKEGDDSKIGFFGSGNKYALACLVRNDIGILIFSGARQIAISTQDISFRGAEFKQILVDGIETSLTTRLGPQWEVWMALREFICNAVDEGGYSWSTTDVISGAHGKTTIYVEVTADVQAFIDQYEHYFAFDNKAILSSHKGRALEGSETAIFRKGVRCFNPEATEKSLWHWDLNYIDINESRLASEYAILAALRDILAAAEDKAVIERYIRNNRQTYFESQISWTYVHALSPAWLTVCKSIGKRFCSASLATLYPPEDQQSFMVVTDSLYDALRKTFGKAFPCVNAGSLTYVVRPPAGDLRQKVLAAKRELASLTGERFPYRIEYGTFASETVIAEVDPSTKLCVLNASMPEETDITAVLLEEQLHILEQAGDGSRKLQSILMMRYLEMMRKHHKTSKKLLKAQEILTA